MTRQWRKQGQTSCKMEAIHISWEKNLPTPPTFLFLSLLSSLPSSPSHSQPLLTLSKCHLRCQESISPSKELWKENWIPRSVSSSFSTFRMPRFRNVGAQRSSPSLGQGFGTQRNKGMRNVGSVHGPDRGFIYDFLSILAGLLIFSFMGTFGSQTRTAPTDLRDEVLQSHQLLL